MEGEQQQGSEQQQPTPKTYSQEEVDRITSKVRRNAQNEAEARVRREYARPQEQPKEQEKPAELKEPKREDFQDYESYVDARADYVGRKAARDERDKAAKEEGERKAVEARAERDKAFRKHADAVMQEIPDFAKKIESADSVMISPSMKEAILDAGAIGPRILYYLVENPQEAERISDLKSESAQMREIGKIEARIEADLEAKKKSKEKEKDAPQEGEQQQEEQRSEVRGEQEERERGSDGRFQAQDKGARKAPDPIDPGTGRSANQDRGPNDKQSDKDWFEARKAQERAERERKRAK